MANMNAKFSKNGAENISQIRLEIFTGKGKKILATGWFLPKLVVVNRGEWGNDLRRAREAQHRSLKDVEGETKIREDFLREFEQGNLDFPLPDIYKMGFLRTYVEFLGLDPDRFLASFSEKGIARDGGENPPPAVNPGDGAVEDADAGKMDSGDGGPANWRTRAQGVVEWWKSHRWQAAGMLAAALALLIFGVIHTGHRADREWEALLRGEAAELVTAGPKPEKKLKILATDNLQVLIREKDTKQKVFSGFLKKGTMEEVDYGENLQISFSDGGAFTIQMENGETLRAKKSGVGWMEVPY
jgi:hypothetical protein